MIGNGNLKVPGMPKLENALLVNGLKVNLISISQLCDHNLFVQLLKTNAPSLTVQTHVLWKEKDHQEISICCIVQELVVPRC